MIFFLNLSLRCDIQIDINNKLISQMDINNKIISQMDIINKIISSESHTIDDIDILISEMKIGKPLGIGIVAELIANRVDINSAARMLDVNDTIVQNMITGIFRRIHDIFVYVQKNPKSPPVEVLTSQCIEFIKSIQSYTFVDVDSLAYDCVSLMTRNVDYIALIALKRGYHTHFYVSPDMLWESTAYGNELPEIRPTFSVLDYMKLYEKGKITAEHIVLKNTIDVAIGLVSLNLPVLQVTMILNSIYPSYKHSSWSRNHHHSWSSDPVNRLSPTYQWEICKQIQQYYMRIKN